MKQGKTLTQLAVELERQQNAKRDFVADTRKLYMTPDSNKVEISLGTKGVELFDTNRQAHKQIATYSNIPQKYYDLMPNDLRAVNVNHWLKNNSDQRLVRTLDGNVRAFLSDRYRALDNFDLAESVLPVLQEVQDMEIVSCELTDRRMYIKALFPQIQADLKVGDTVQSGVVISNSEIGQGSLRVEPLVYRLVCLNGMISNYSQKRYHVGKHTGEEDMAQEIYRDETRKADDKAFWLKVQDTVRASVSAASFERVVQKMRETMDMEMTISPVDVVERTQKKFGMTDSEGSSVLSHLISGGSLNGFGLMNAITRTAQDIDSYDRATEFERMGGQIIELGQSEWRSLAVAA